MISHANRTNRTPLISRDWIYEVRIATIIANPRRSLQKNDLPHETDVFKILHISVYLKKKLMSQQIFDYREISKEQLKEHFQIGDFGDGDSFRQSKEIPVYQNKKLRFNSPWLYSPFGWGKYNTLTLSSFSKRTFDLDNPNNKKCFRRFLKNIGGLVEEQVSTLDNPDFLSTSFTHCVQYNEQYGNFQFRFPIPKKYFDADGNFEGKVFKSTNPENLEYSPSSVKAIEPKSYVSFVGYIGRVSQSKKTVRYRVVIEHIHWIPCSDEVEEKETITTSSNLFLNVPSLKKRKIVVNANTDAEASGNTPNKPKKTKIQVE